MFRVCRVFSCVRHGSRRAEKRTNVSPCLRAAAAAAAAVVVHRRAAAINRNGRARALLADAAADLAVAPQVEFESKVRKLVIVF